MTKLGDLQTKKTIHELAKEFPKRTYGELEKYRDANREEDVIGMGHNHPPNERKEQDDPTIFDVARDNFKKELNWKEKYDKEHKLRQETEGELSIMKGIETNRVKEAQAKCDQLQDQLDRSFKENNDLYNRIADLTEVAKSKDYFRDPDYQYLIEENRKLEEERNELLIDNKRLAAQVEDRINQMRRSGL